MRVGVLGAGSFGSALSLLLADKGYEVTLWVHSKDTYEEIKKKKENTIYLPGIPFPENIAPTQEIEEVLYKKDLILSVIPTQYTRGVLKKVRKYYSYSTPFIVASKGIELKTHKLLDEIVKEELGSFSSFLFLGGPAFAKEVANKIPTAVVLAGEDASLVKEMQKVFFTPYFRVYGSSDVKGVELGGALKNIYAIASGISDGLGLGHNTRAAIITRGLREISRLGITLGANIETFMGLSGLGDLILTATGDLSRNRRVGLAIGKGEKLKMRMVAEGIPTTKSAYEIAKEKKVEMPILETLYEILYKEKDPKEAISSLMLRELTFEHE